jgi:hypothetical protein
MTQTKLKGELILEADRKIGAFQSVPEHTEELTIKSLLPSEAAELLLLGHRLKHLTKLTLLYGLLERLDFLESFRSIRTLYVSHLNDLKDYTGIGHCVKLTRLSLTPSLSSIGSLSFLRHLPELEWLHLEGPNPSKGMDKIEPLRKIQRLSLYAPRWSMEQLPINFPALEDLTISQGGYQSLDFIARLERLAALDIAYARKLSVFDAIGRLPRLRSLRIGHAIRSLQSCSQFGCSSTVEQIRITGCTQLKDIGSLVDWPALREAKIYDCPLIPVAQMEMLRKTGKIVNGK